MANYEKACNVAEELLMELTGKGLSIPPTVFTDLKSARTLASILRTQLDHDTELKTMSYLQSAEANLLSLAESDGGREYADDWQMRISLAYSAEQNASSPSKSKYVTGLPKTEHWVRIQKDELAEISGLDELAARFGLAVTIADDGYFLIHGGKNDVKAMLYEIRKKVGKMCSDEQLN